MKTLSRPTEWLTAEYRWAVWIGYVLISTVMLVGPSLALMLRQQIDTGDNAALDYQLFLASKIFHVVDYLGMALLTAWLPAARRLRVILLGFVAMHALGTEFLQQYVETRTPSGWDVGLDYLGILIGVGLTWRWWRSG